MIQDSVIEMFSANLHLGVLAEAVNDLEGVRIATSHRTKATGREAKAMGVEVSTEMLDPVLEGLEEAEVVAVKALEAAMRKHPLGKHVKATSGLGLKQTARLIAAIGDPFWHVAQQRPRTVSELWAYSGLHVVRLGQATSGDHCCPAEPRLSVGEGHPVSETLGVSALANTSSRPGHVCTDSHGQCAGAGPFARSHPGQTSIDAQTSPAGVAPKRRKGERANWSTQAKTRAFLCATSCVKAMTSPYRPVYDLAREKAAVAVHVQECPQCGRCANCGNTPGINRKVHLEESGCAERKVEASPAGTPLRLSHQHARGLRAVSKAILKGLWIASRDWHLEHGFTYELEAA